MTTATSLTSPLHADMQTDGRQDRRKDVRLDTDRDEQRARSAFVMVLANHKGGVTKTTSAANLGACLAEAGQRVLMIDSDPQANLGEAFGWREEQPGMRLEDLLAEPDTAARAYPELAVGGSSVEPFGETLGGW